MNWMKYRWLYLLISLIVIGSGVFGLFKWGLNFGVDFKGGSIAEYKFEKEISTDKIISGLDKEGVKAISVHKLEGNTYLFKLNPLTSEERQKTKTFLTESDKENKVDELRFETVGPSVGPELIKKTVYAIVVASSLILLWVAYQFKSIKFGACAVLAMIHDSLVLVGTFALLGHFFQTEIDFLFVTAVLTILSFSVHDTIVVYDRVRETRKKIGGSMTEMANMAISQTMVRSLNNSFTIIFMLIALILLGGLSIRWFAVALLVGTVSGTYSSPFVAVSLLVTWDQIEKKIKKVQS
ncbi:MAG: protein translocase subunit SecF [bacterium]